jgi:hypothetical protein
VLRPPAGYLRTSAACALPLRSTRLRGDRRSTLSLKVIPPRTTKAITTKNCTRDPPAPTKTAASTIGDLRHGSVMRLPGIGAGHAYTATGPAPSPAAGLHALGPAELGQAPGKVVMNRSLRHCPRRRPLSPTSSPDRRLRRRRRRRRNRSPCGGCWAGRSSFRWSAGPAWFPLVRVWQGRRPRVRGDAGPWRLAPTGERRSVMQRPPAVGPRSPTRSGPLPSSPLGVVRCVDYA